MDKRIFGIETEFGISYSSPESRPLAPEEVARYLFRKVVSWGRSSNVFLTNGSRLYLDVGSHPEYATAECDDLAQLIAHDRAGELILDDLVDEAQERLAAEGFNGTVYLFKNNTDSAGNSYGSHENYLIPRRGEFSRLAEILIPFLVTRQLIAGAGKILKTPHGATFAFSQRADHIWEGVSSATTRSRPIINTRDEPHADAEFYRRLHVIVGDSNMSETTALLKVGTVDLILRMIEAGVIMRDMRMENPIRSIREISHDLSGRALVRLANGRQLTALEIQREYLGKVTAFVAEHGAHNPHVPLILDLWERTLDAIESGDTSTIDTEVDWAIKKKLMDNYREPARAGPRRAPDRPAGPDLPRHLPHPRPVLPAAVPRGRPPRGGRHRGQGRGGRPAADHPRQTPRRLRPAGPGTGPRLHRGLGASEAQRPRPPDHPVQGSVPQRGRARGCAAGLYGLIPSFTRYSG